MASKRIAMVPRKIAKVPRKIAKVLSETQISKARKALVESITSLESSKKSLQYLSRVLGNEKFCNFCGNSFSSQGEYQCDECLPYFIDRSFPFDDVKPRKIAKVVSETQILETKDELSEVIMSLESSKNSLQDQLETLRTEEFCSMCQESFLSLGEYHCSKCDLYVTNRSYL